MSGTESGASLCEVFVESVPVAGASITVFRQPGTQSTIGSSDTVAARLDQLQFDLGEGPRWETARTGLATMSGDLRNDPHPSWPVFGAAAAELGVGALFTFPIRIGNQLLGVADLYRHGTGLLGTSETARAVAAARGVAGSAVDVASRSADSSVELSSEGVALRREVHQAIGMILIQLDVDAASAFAVLRAYAFSHAVSVEEVASDIVARRLNFVDDPIEPNSAAR
jgi:hypothetical protein